MPASMKNKTAGTPSLSRASARLAMLCRADGRECRLSRRMVIRPRRVASHIEPCTGHCNSAVLGLRADPLAEVSDRTCPRAAASSFSVPAMTIWRRCGCCPPRPSRRDSPAATGAGAPDALTSLPAQRDASATGCRRGARQPRSPRCCTCTCTRTCRRSGTGCGSPSRFSAIGCRIRTYGSGWNPRLRIIRLGQRISQKIKGGRRGVYPQVIIRR